MSAEQGNVQPWRENVERVQRRAVYMRDNTANGIVGGFCEEVILALDALTTQIEELERERDEANELVGEDAGSYLFNMKARSEKAERALAENEQTWEDMRAYNIRLEERAREAERALAEIIAEADELLLWQPGKKGYAVAHKRFYDAIYPYRSSEDTGDES